jgi:hypothetical protein
LLVVVLVVVVVAAFGLVVVLSTVVDPAAGPDDVVVVEPDVVPADCAKAMPGAIARNSARSTRLSRKIGRIGFLPLESEM